MPAPIDNQNATVHGLRSSRPILATAALTKRYPDLSGSARKYARLMRALVTKTHGTVSHCHEEVINEAARFELAARIYQRLINGLAEAEASPDRARAMNIEVKMFFGQHGPRG